MRGLFSDRKRKFPTETALAAAVLLAVAGLLLGAWRWDAGRREEALRSEVRLAAAQVAARLELFFRDRLQAVEETALRFRPSLAEEPARFRELAGHYLRLFPGMQAINFIDREGVIRIVAPEAGNLAALGRNLFQHPEKSVAETLRAAMNRDAVVRTPVVQLLQGKIGMATYRRLTDEDGNLAGFINGVFAVEDLVESCLSEALLRRRFALSLREPDGRIIFELNDTVVAQNAGFMAKHAVMVADRPWHLFLGPAPATLAELYSTERILFPICGIVLAIALAFFIRTDLMRRRRLRESEARYRALFDSAGDAIFLLKGDRFVECNPRTLEMFRCRAEDILGETPYGFSPPCQPDGRDSREKALEKIDRAHRQWPISFEWTHSRPDGTTFDCEVTLSRLELSGRRYLLAVVRDTSSRKEAERRKREIEQRMFEAQKLESVGVLAGGIAHEFNNLLAVILGNADLARSASQPGSDLRLCLEEIRGAAERAAHLTNQILAYAERGRISTGPVNINDMIRRNQGLMKATISKKAALQLDLAGRLPPVTADESQLRQVLMNLVTNASEALEDRPGNITVRTAAKTAPLPGEESPRTLVVLEISDDGCGMDEEVKRRIFDPFFTTKFAGRGLGMAAVYGIVHGHGGSLEVSSKPGSGTTVRVLLPAAEKKIMLADEKAAVTEMAAAGFSVSVLLVDDEPFVRQVGRKMLERLGCKVITADDGDQALEIFRTRRQEIDLVILDMTMPRKSGDEVFGELTQVDATVPVIVCSGFSEQDASARMGDRRPAAFLHKPYDLAALEEVLKKALASNR